MKTKTWPYILGTLILSAYAITLQNDIAIKTAPPSIELTLIGRLTDMDEPWVACGIIHFVAIMEYTDLTIIDGVYRTKKIYVVHSCPRLSGSSLSEGNGSPELFQIGNYHLLHLTKENIFGDIQDINIEARGIPSDSMLYYSVEADLYIP